MKVKIELEKTVQVRQYEPLRVCISAEDDVPDSSHIPTLYREISGKLYKILMREYEKYDELSSQAPEANSAKKATPIPKLKKKTTAKVVKAEY